MSIEEIYPNLQHEDPRVRERIMQQIAGEYTEETIFQLISALDSASVAYRHTLARTLRIIGLDAVPSLREKLDSSENAIVRASVAQTLAAIAFPDDDEEQISTEALAGLQQAMEDPNPLVYLATVNALSMVGSPAFDFLHQALASDNIAVQVAAVDALGSLGDKRGIPVLSTLAQDKTIDIYIQEAAVSALSRLEQLIDTNQ